MPRPQFIGIFRRRAQRGLTLVEVGIVLAVVGLLVGAGLVPITALWEREKYQQQEARMAQIETAILGYAVRHTTAQRQLIYTESTPQREFTIPHGRPYLPCPDINNDGYEDRNGNFSASGELTEPLPVVTVQAAAADNDLLTNGDCDSARGLLPWRSLGVPPTDVWGNYHTYEVDDAFSNAVVGFNQETVADVFDTRLSVSLSARGDMAHSRRDHTARPRRPIVVCDDTVMLCNATAVADAGGALTLMVSVGASVTTAVTVESVLQAGQVAESALALPRRQYAVGDIRDGLPFVVVSHGQNGHGAVSYDANPPDGTAFSCRHPIASAPVSVAVTVDIAPRYLDEAVNFPVVEGKDIALTVCPKLEYTDSAATYELTEGNFITRPPVRNPQEGNARALHTTKTDRFFDDVLMWQSKEELFLDLTRAKVLPADNLPPLRSY